MKVWLVRDFEPLPGETGRRLMRMGLLAKVLVERGHEVTWFTSSFDHYLKRQRTITSYEDEAGLRVRVLETPGYQRNISFARILYNRAFARAFVKVARSADALPDVIATDVPSTEMAKAVVAFGFRHHIPTVLSIRDIWPDFFLDFIPGVLRPLGALLVWSMERQVRYACRRATSVIGISKSYLEWAKAKGKRPASNLDGIIPLGYAPVPTASDRRIEARLETAGLTSRHLVSFVGSWGNTYDLDLVLNAAQLLKDRTDIGFVLAGNAVVRPDLMARAAGLSNILLPGWLDAYEIAALLRKSDIGLLPYHVKAPQGVPNKVFEYMAYGAYQLSTLSGEVDELYRETGTGQVIDGSPKLMADAIVTRLDHPSRIDRFTIIEQFSRRFDAELLYNDMTTLIERVVEQTRSSGSQ